MCRFAVDAVVFQFTMLFFERAGSENDQTVFSDCIIPMAHSLILFPNSQKYSQKAQNTWFLSASQERIDVRSGERHSYSLHGPAQAPVPPWPMCSPCFHFAAYSLSTTQREAKLSPCPIKPYVINSESVSPTELSYKNWVLMSTSSIYCSSNLDKFIPASDFLHLLFLLPE